MTVCQRDHCEYPDDILASYREAAADRQRLAIRTDKLAALLGEWLSWHTAATPKTMQVLYTLVVKTRGELKPMPEWAWGPLCPTDQPLTDGWVRRECSCVHGELWAGDHLVDCTRCNGLGWIAIHVASRRIAAYPGGRFLGCVPKPNKES